MGSKWKFTWTNHLSTKKAIRLISFAHYQAYCSSLFKNLNLLKLTDIVKCSNILFTHNTINNNSPATFRDYFVFNGTSHQHQTVNSLTSIYSIPSGSLKLPLYNTNSGKSSIKYICSNIWNSTLKDLSITNIEKYNLDPFWMNKTNIKTFKDILKKHFLKCYWLYHIRNLFYYLQETPLFRSFSFFLWNLF